MLSWKSPGSLWQGSYGLEDQGKVSSFRYVRENQRKSEFCSKRFKRLGSSGKNLNIFCPELS